MKAITLHQPWASLIACGLKTIETRHWPPPRAVVGERIAIHAAKRPPDVREWNEDLRQAFLQHVAAIPLGAIVTTARLAAVLKVTQNPLLRGCEPGYGYVLVTTRLSTPEHLEIEIDSFGDFSLGRWLWMLTDVKKVEPPIPARGHQRLWDWCQHGREAL